MGSKRNVPPRERMSAQNLIIRGVPPEYIEGTLEDYVQNDEVKIIMTRYLNNMHDMYEDRANLCLYGSNGSGKTYLSTLIVKEAYRLRYSSAMTTVANLLDLTFKPKKTQEDLAKLKMYKEAEFLVLDEVGKENFTKTGSNINLVEESLRGAVVRGQVVIICTNLPLEGEHGLFNQYGNSIKSLINSYFRIKFEGDDYRPSQLRKKKSASILSGVSE